MRTFLVIALACLAPLLAAKTVEMTVSGYTTARETGATVSGVEFAVLPDLYWERYGKKPARGVFEAGVALQGEPSNVDGHFKLKLSCRWPAEADIPKDDEGKDVSLRAILLFKSKDRGDSRQVVFDPGAKIGATLQLGTYRAKGIAVDAADAPLSAQVITPVADRGGELQFFSTKTNEAGEFTVFTPLEFRYDLVSENRVVAVSYPSDSGYSFSEFTGSWRGEVDLGRVQFREPGTLKLGVLASLDRYGTVKWEGPLDTPRPRKRNLKAGDVEDRQVAAGKYRLTVKPRTSDRGLETEFEVTAGGVTDLGIVGQLPDERTIRVNLSAKESADLKSAVGVAWLATGVGYYPAWNETAQCWEFTLPLPKVTSFVFEFSLEGHASVRKTIEIGPDSESIDITLPVAGRVICTAKDAEGDRLYCSLYAVANGSEAHAALDKGYAAFEEWWDSHDNRDPAAYRITSGIEAALPVGKFTLVGIAIPIEDSVRAEVEITADTVTSIELQQPAYFVTLKVTRGGKPLASNVVYVMRPDAEAKWVRLGYERETDAEGCTVVPFKTYGKYTLAVAGENFWLPKVRRELDHRAFEVVDGTTELNIDVTPKFEPFVTVELKTLGDPITKIYVSRLANWIGAPTAYRVSDMRDYAPGGTQIGELTPGWYRMLCYADKAKFMQPDYIIDFEVLDEGPQSLLFTPARRTLRGRLKPDDSVDTKAGRKLHWYYEASAGWGHQKEMIVGGEIAVDTEGNFVFDSPPIHEFVLAASAGAARGYRVVGPDEHGILAHVPMTASLGSLLVRVQSPNGADQACTFMLRDAAGTLVCPNYRQVWQSVRDDGAAVLSDLPGGTFDLVVRATGCATLVVKDIKVVPNEAKVIEVSLREAPQGRWDLTAAGVKTIDLTGCAVEFLDAGGKAVLRWDALSQVRDCPVSIGYDANYQPRRLWVSVTDPATATIRITVPGYKPVEIDIGALPKAEDKTPQLELKPG